MSPATLAYERSDVENFQKTDNKTRNMDLMR